MYMQWPQKRIARKQYTKEGALCIKFSCLFGKKSTSFGSSWRADMKIVTRKLVALGGKIG